MSERTVTPAHIALGQRGEQLATDELVARGFQLVETNWRCAYGELDAVLWDADELVFLEVKTRVGETHGSAEESMGAAKARKLGVAAEMYLAEHLEIGDPVWRIDLAAITLDRQGRLVRFSHIANAALLE